MYTTTSRSDSGSLNDSKRVIGSLDELGVVIYKRGINVVKTSELFSKLEYQGYTLNSPDCM